MAEGQKLTFFEKKQSACPVCNAKFFREDLLSGGGRLIAGNLTRELRRQYDAFLSALAEWDRWNNEEVTCLTWLLTCGARTTPTFRRTFAVASASNPSAHAV